MEHGRHIGRSSGFDAPQAQFAARAVPSLFVPCLHTREHMPQLMQRRPCHLNGIVLTMGTDFNKVRLLCLILQPLVEVRHATRASAHTRAIREFGRPDKLCIAVISQKAYTQMGYSMNELLMRDGTIDRPMGMPIKL